MRAPEALRPGVDWSQVAARECFDCGTDDLPGVFAELGRRARGEVRYEEGDFWAPVREDVAWPGLSEAGAGCGCGGSCGSAACGGGEADEVDDFWAPVVETGDPGRARRSRSGRSGFMSARGLAAGSIGGTLRRRGEGLVDPSSLIEEATQPMSVDAIARRESDEVLDGGRIRGYAGLLVWLIVGDADAFQIYVLSMKEGFGPASYGGKKVLTRLDVSRLAQISETNPCDAVLQWTIDCYRRRELQELGIRDWSTRNGIDIQFPLFAPERLVHVGQALVELEVQVLAEDGMAREVEVDGTVVVMDSSGDELGKDTFWQQSLLMELEMGSCDVVASEMRSALGVSIVRSGLLAEIWADAVASGALPDDTQGPFMGPQDVSVESVLRIVGDRTGSESTSGLSFTVYDWVSEFCSDCVEEVGDIPEGGEDDDVITQAPL